MEPPSANTNNETTTTKINLFDYTEEELYCSNTNSNHGNNNNNASANSNSNSKPNSTKPLKFNHYELLQIPIHATSHDIKKAYRKLSLQYHPDKTGRDENDYVFLAIKNAYDTLMDPVKRNGYDSTVLVFDDSIPPSRNTLLLNCSNSGSDTSNNNNSYTDDDFYQLYGPVFTRNLRFDAKLRPELAMDSNSSNNSSSHSSSKKHNNKTPISPPPSLGDADTPLDQVYAFYEYWQSFSSWRDFSLQAQCELQLSDVLEQSESRYEKRYYQKEIDKRTKQLKRNEMTRIQTLVERAMEADPRLRKERQEQLLAKERLLEEKRLEKIRIEEERIQQEQLQLQQEEQSKIQKQQEKIQREQYKKLLRKSKQTLRKSVSASFDQDLLLLQQQQADMDKLEDEVNEKNNEQQPLWNDLYDLNQDIDYLCTRLTLEEINALNENLTEYASDNDEYGGSHRLLLEFLHQHIQEQKVKEQADSAANGNNVVKLATNTANTTNVWSTAELSTLIKAMKKYPMGGAGRWDAICNMINHNCTLAVPRTRQECIDKYNSMLKKQQLQNKNNNNNNNNNSSMGTTSNGVPDVAVTTATTNSTTGHTTTSNGGATNVDMGDTMSLKQQQSTDDAIDDANDANHSETWSTDQDQLLQEALLLYPATMEKNERWSLIASHIPNKNKKACVQRFKTIRQEIISSQQAPSSTSK